MPKARSIGGNGVSSTRMLNIRTVIDIIRSREPVARKEIAKSTGLSVPTVCRVIDDLLAEGTVREVAPDSAPRQRGPKTALVEINPDAGWVLALQLGGEHIGAAVMDLTGNMRLSIERPLVNVQGEALVTSALHSVVKEILQTAEPRYGKPLAIGASSAGIIDPDSGMVLLSFNLQLRDYPLAGIVRQVCDVPVQVRNDVASAALAEARLGAGQTSSDFGYIIVGSGIGASYVLNGEVLEHNFRSEFGLMIVAQEGDPERFEGRGYLESIASGRGIAAAARRALESGAQSRMSELSPDGPAYVTTSVVLEAAKQGDRTALDILNRAADHLAVGIVNLANILQIKSFVLDGSLPDAGEVFWRPLTVAVRKYEYWPGEIELAPSTLGGDAVLLGAGLLALDRAFEKIAEV